MDQEEVVKLPGVPEEYDRAEKTLKEMFDEALGAAQEAAMVAVPALAWPVVKQLFKFVVSKLGKFLYGELEKRIAVLVINVKVQSEKRSYEKATAELRAALENKDTVIEEKERLLEEYKKRLADLISFKP